MSVVAKIIRIVLTSKSQVKIDAICECDRFGAHPAGAQTKTIKPVTVVCSNPNQPINSAEECALNRIHKLTAEQLYAMDYIVSIENGIRLTDDLCEDVCVVVVKKIATNQTVSAESYSIPVDRKYYLLAKEASDAEAAVASPLGFAPAGIKYTLGEMIHREFPEIPADNWMADPRFGGKNRKDQILDALKTALAKL